MNRVLSTVLFAVSLAFAPTAWSAEPAPAPAATPGQTKAAGELMEQMHMPEVLKSSMDTMLASQISANPGLIPFEDTLRSFLEKYMAWDAIKTDMIDLYAREFTEAELKELVAFYRTPTGQKAIEKMPVLMAKGAEYGRSVVVAHQPELEAAIAARAAEIMPAPAPMPPPAPVAPAEPTKKGKK